MTSIIEDVAVGTKIAMTFLLVATMGKYPKSISPTKISLPIPREI
jgi:hypothetical protein